MTAHDSEPIVVTEPDYERIDRLIAAQGRLRDRAGLLALREELERADVVAAGQVPAGVVTMNSRVRFVDEGTGEHQDVTLVFPADADAGSGRVSILAPLGSALLGLRVGQAIDWPFPSGMRRLRVVAVDPPAR
jgi:regulator of nucleoside diphosphate kinase